MFSKPPIWEVFSLVFSFVPSAEGGKINVLVLEISPYVFLLDDEGVNTFFKREHLKK